MPLPTNDSQPTSEPIPPSDGEITEELKVLYPQGSTLRELAERYETSEETIRRLLIGAGIPRRPRGQPVGKHLPSGGRTTDPDGYVLLKANGHPHANSNGYVREHRLVMDQELGRYLRPEEVVHHINGIKNDNRPENLQPYESNSAHKQDDMLGNSWAKGDFSNPKRSVRTLRSPAQILIAIRRLAATLNRPVQRNDLEPPYPSYRAVARTFGSWQEGVAIALAKETLPGDHDSRGRDTS